MHPSCLLTWMLVVSTVEHVSSFMTPSAPASTMLRNDRWATGSTLHSVSEETKEDAPEDFVETTQGPIMEQVEEKEPEASLPTKEAEPFPLEFLESYDEQQVEFDENYMKLAIETALSAGGERSPLSAYPYPTIGAVLVAADGTVMGKGRADYDSEATRACLQDAGLQITPLSEWCVSWPSDSKLREQLTSSTLYLTMEPFDQRRGTAYPPMTQLIAQTGIPRVVIGCANPVPELATVGATALHTSGISVNLGHVCHEECLGLITEYSKLANSKFQSMARSHFRRTQRPLGFLHCSVVDSDNLEAFARNGNAFGSEFGGKSLGFRDFGSYEIAPPPEVIWADNGDADELFDDDEDMDEGGDDSVFDVDFEDETFQEEMGGNPMMPWYEQVDAVCATFPKEGNGPDDDDSVTARMNGLKWLATYGEQLPTGVERILVMDAADLDDLPLSNDNPNLPPGVDVEHFWRAPYRKKTRILLRLGAHDQARTAAQAAAVAAKMAADAAQRAAEAIELGEAADAAELALEAQKAAEKARDDVLGELSHTQEIKSKLQSMGVIIESIDGKEPIDVMNHLGKRNGMQSVVWRAGCWGDRGVKAILAGAFQWVSAHLAVDAVGGKFWQLMLAEKAVQAACGPERRVQVFAEQEDISLEYCDAPDVDQDCVMRIDGRPVRHIRLDCRVALFDENRPREFVLAKTEKLTKKRLEEQAPWFL